MNLGKLILIVLLLQWGGMVALAGEIVPANNKTQKYTAPNGVPVVNIATPNGRGLSHNRYNQFDVNSIGAVLNNAIGVQKSRLAGAIRGNPNLNPSITPGGRTASIILNEVTSTKRSALNGFLEVNGQKADVIVANPNGITTNGLGFINTNRAVLTTGTPNIAGGALTGFDVRRGDLLVQGNGIKATSQGFLDLVTRSLKVEGRVNASDLHITTGANRWDYVNRTRTALTPSGTTPTYAVDTALLGGMFANRIKLVATEAGVGVRMLGTAAATADNITVTANGVIELKNTVNAAHNLAVTYNGTQASGTIVTNGDTSISAGNDITLISDSGDITLSTAKLASLDTLTLTATTGSISNASGGSQAVESSGNMNLNAKTGITNNGKFLAGNNLTVRGTDAATALTLTNVGRMQSGATLDIAGAGDNKQVRIINNNSNALLLTAQQLNINALEVNNSGSIHSRADSAITSDLLINTDTAGYSASGNLSLTTSNDFSNAGALFAGTDLTITATNNLLTNSESGTIDSDGTMTIHADRFHNFSDLNATGDITINTATEFKNMLFVRGGSLFATTTTFGLLSSAEMAAYNDVTTDTADVFLGTQSFVTSGTDHNNRLTGGGGWSVYKYSENTGSNTFGTHNDTRGYLRARKKFIEKNRITGTADKSQILSGGVLTLNIGAGTALNQGAIMSATTVRVTGVGSITNDILNHTKDTFISKYKYTAHYRYGSLVSDSADRLYFFNAGDGSYESITAASSSDSAARNSAAANPAFKSTAQLVNIGAGVFANTLDIQVGGSVTNAGSIIAASTTSRQSNLSTLDNTAALPTNPNGLFVTTQNSNAAFLVEGNPRFGLDASYLGSDYLIGQLNSKVNTDLNIRRLGDASYENKLIADQLIKQTGRNILKGFKQDARLQTRVLFDNAVRASKGLNLSYGVALSKAQINNLKTDMVWMVKQKVNGIEVMAPVVYLAQATLDANNPGGATLSAGNMNIKSKDFLNEGGNVEAGEALAIETEGDLKNVSGTISGADVALKSTDGSIINETAVIGDGLQIGKQASISAGNNLALNAAKDIKNLGANMSAGNDASLKAGRDVVFDTVQKKTRSLSSSAQRGGDKKTATVTVTETTKNIRSGLSVGGDLNMDAGRDVVIAGSDIKAGGDAALTAGRNQKFLAREDTTRTSSKSVEIVDKSGFLKKDKTTTTTTTDSLDGKAVVSTLEVGGNLKRTAGNTLLTEGGKVDVGGNYKEQAENIVNLAAKDRHESKAVVDVKHESMNALAGLKDAAKKGFDAAKNSGIGKGLQANLGKLGDTGLGKALSAAGSGIKDAASKAAKSKVGKFAMKGAKRGLTAATKVAKVADKMSVGRKLAMAAAKKATGAIPGMKDKKVVVSAETSLTDSTETTDVADTTARTTTINVGGSMERTAANEIKDVGTEIDVGANFKQQANKIISLAARDTHTENVHTDSLTVEAKASAKAGLKQGGGSAEASVSTTSEEKNQFDRKSTARAGVINVGGNLSSKSTNETVLEGTHINVKGDAEIAAKRLDVLAARDESASETSTTTQSVTQDVKAGVDKHLVYDGEQEIASTTTTVQASKSRDKISSSVARAASLGTGGNLKITTGDGMSFEGTKIDVGGKAELDAGKGNIDMLAAIDTKSSSHTEETVSLKQTKALGVAAGVKTGDLDKAAAGEEVPEASAGDVHAALISRNTVSNSGKRSTEKDTTAHAATIASGKGIDLKANEVNLQGTDVASAGDVKIDAKALNFTAAADTHSETLTEHSEEGTVEVSVGLQASSNFITAGAGVSGEVAGKIHREESTKARVGSILSGGNIEVSTVGDSLFEGVNLASNGDTILSSSQGHIDMIAARDTSKLSDYSGRLAGSVEGQIAIGVSAIGGDGSVSAKAEIGINKKSSSDAITGSVNSARNLIIKSKQDATFEGTVLGSGGIALIESDEGSVNLMAAHSTASEFSFDGALSAEAHGSFNSGGKGTGASASMEVSGSIDDSNQAKTASITGAKGVNIKSRRDVNMEGTAIGSGGDINVIAEQGDVNITAAKSTEKGLAGGVSLSVGTSSESSTENGKKESSSEKSKRMGVELSGKFKETFKGASFKSGNKINIQSGRDVTLENTKLTGNSGTSVKAGSGTVKKTTSRDSDIELSIGISKEKSSESGSGTENDD